MTELVQELIERPRRAAATYVVALLVVIAAISLFWPVGIVLALIAGVFAVVAIGRHMQAESADVPHDGELPLPPTVEDELRDDVRMLRHTLGDDYRDFARAALLIADSQWASAASLQRGLQISYDRARRLLGLLEAERFVGPLTGTRQREVLIAPEDRPALERILAAR